MSISVIVIHYSYRYTAVQAFGKVVTETNDLAGQRELIAEYLQNDVLKPLQELAKNTLSERKKLMVDGVELHKAVKDSMDLLDRVRVLQCVHVNNVGVYICTCTYAREKLVDKK